jgi:PAS domain S-box-containing protein
MDRARPVRILLIDDDESARVLTRALLDRIPSRRFELDWVATAAGGMEAIRRREHDLYLVDYRLDERSSGIDLVRQARDELIRIPMILLTGKGRLEVDVAAMEAGASDYLNKERVDPELLERSIRYALERARTESALRDSERRHRSMFDHLPIGLYRTTMDGELLEANPALVQMLGRPPRDRLEFDHARHFFVSPNHRQTFLARLDQFGEVRGFESRVRRHDGRLVHLRSSARAHRDDTGHTVYVEGAVEDVTEEREARDLHGRAARFDWVFQDSGLPILVLDLQGRVSDHNPAFLAAFGYRPSQVAGRPVVELVEEGDREAVDQEVRSLLAGVGAGLMTEAPRRFLASDGEVLWANTRTGLVRNPRGQPDHLLVILEDVAEAHHGSPGA